MGSKPMSTHDDERTLFASQPGSVAENAVSANPQKALEGAISIPSDGVVVHVHAPMAREFAPLKSPGVFGLADALLKAPAGVAHELNENRSSFTRLLVLVAACMMMTGIVVASFSGGYQYLAVPLKLALGLLFGAGLCLPSLYIFACLSGDRHTFREVAAALLMGLGIQALILTAFAPVAWIFSQSTSSPTFMGLLYFLMLLVSTGFGLGLTGRVLAARGRPVSALWIWSIMFVVVMLQLSTNLRPLVGEYDGVRFAEKQFFLSHWFESLRNGG
jgi:hypothetical protein